MAITKKGIYYPDNYDKVADVPADLKKLAESVDTLIEENVLSIEKSNEDRDKKITSNAESIKTIQKSIADTTKEINEKDNAQDDSIMAIQENIKTINSKNEEQDSTISDNATSIKNLQAKNVEINAENERLREDIKSIAIQGEVNGESIHIEDSSSARCELEICGNHSQDTREGYNFLDLSNFSTQTKNGVTATKNEDGSIKLVGTNSGDTFNINLSTINGEIGDYIASGVTGGSRETYFLAIVQTGVKTFTEVTNESSNFSLTEETTIAANIYIVKGATINTTIYPMLIKGTENKPYEQYGASPSLDYPSPVKSVGDNVNYFDINSVTNSLIILESGNLYPNDSWRTTDFIEVKANIYTLSWESITDYFQCNIAFYDKDKKYLSYIQYTNRTFSNTFDVKNNAKYMRISYSVKSGGTSYTREKIKLETGNKRTEYSSYNCGSAKIDIFNKNYLSKIPKTSVTAQGITSTFDGQKFICKSTTQTNYFNLFTEKVYKKISKGIKTFSTNKLKKGRAFIHFDYVDGTGQNYYTSINTNQVRFTLNKDVESYRLNVDSITAGDTIDDNIYVQLEDGNIATEIEKAENQEYLVDVQQEMLDGDTFVRQDGKWYEKHNWITLLNENIANNIDGIKDESKKTITTSINLTETPAERSAISNILTYTNNWNDTEHMIFSASLNTIYCLYNKDRFSELNYETIKKEIGEFCGIIKYKSNKSTYLECTEAQSKVLDEIYNKAHTYKNITNISAESSEVNPIINVKYLKDTEIEHNKLQSQIDEIKQLLSTTQTSSLLLNNLQTDLESEVE